MFAPRPYAEVDVVTLRFYKRPLTKNELIVSAIAVIALIGAGIAIVNGSQFIAREIRPITR